MDRLNTPLSWALLLAVVIVCILNRDGILERLRTKQTPRAAPSPNQKPSLEDPYLAIEPLPNFDLNNEEPLKLRPFKPRFHMTMALENTTLSDLLPFDNTYRERVQIRQTLISTQRHEVLACTPSATPAVHELYTWLTKTYLSTRYPTLFHLGTTHLHNNITGVSLPLTPPASGESALEILGSNIDTEFLLLLPTSTSQQQPIYHLSAFINTFPSGFSTRSKLSQSLAAIHAPVPGYASKLEKSMDKYFAKLPVGKIVKRANWSVSTNTDLFCLEGNHMSVDDVEKGKEGEEEEEIVDLGKTVLRCERQTLHRLPDTGAIVFAFKTYMYPIRELRDEGSGEILAEAIDGLGLGSVPGMTVYKRQVIWGEKVKAFLRGEIDG